MVQAPAGMEIIGAMRTDTGLVRTLNEDSVAWVTPHDDAAATNRGSLALVADGMGGHAAGEVASAPAAHVIPRPYYDSHGPIPQVLANAFAAANRAIIEYAQEHPECRGMGTTCTVLAFRDSQAWVPHIGDSGAHLLPARHAGQRTPPSPRAPRPPPGPQGQPARARRQGQHPSADRHQGPAAPRG